MAVPCTTAGLMIEYRVRATFDNSCRLREMCEMCTKKEENEIITLKRAEE